jgi:hypothetical protein
MPRRSWSTPWIAEASTIAGTFGPASGVTR